MDIANLLVKLAAAALFSFSALAVPAEGVNDLQAPLVGTDAGTGDQSEPVPVQTEGAAGTAYNLASPPAPQGSPCVLDKLYGPPFKFIGVDASDDAGEDKVLAVARPWKLDSRAYIWEDNDDSRQHWYLWCVGFDEHYQLAKYRFVYAYKYTNKKTALCLTASSLGNGIPLTLQRCGKDKGRQTWSIVAERWYPETYTIRPFDFQSWCFDVNRGRSANGTAVFLWGCNGHRNQEWYWREH